MVTAYQARDARRDDGSTGQPGARPLSHLRPPARRLQLHQQSGPASAPGYASVSSVRVKVASEFEYTIELTLSNGPTRPIRVTEPVTIEEGSADDPVDVARMDRDATGFTHALHILEGIAAEGRDWINREPPPDDSYESAVRTDA
jgi:hypothetical protein